MENTDSTVEHLEKTLYEIKEQDIRDIHNLKSKIKRLFIIIKYGYKSYLKYLGK